MHLINCVLNFSFKKQIIFKKKKVFGIISVFNVFISYIFRNGKINTHAIISIKLNYIKNIRHSFQNLSAKNDLNMKLCYFFNYFKNYGIKLLK